MKIQFITTTRKIVFLLIGLVIFSLEGYAQSKKITNYNPKDGIKTEWLKDFYGAGFSKANDSLYVSEESLKLLRDESYRQKMYPIIYNWNQALAFIKQQELKKAFWFL